MNDVLGNINPIFQRLILSYERLAFVSHARHLVSAMSPADDRVMKAVGLAVICLSVVGGISAGPAAAFEQTLAPAPQATDAPGSGLVVKPQSSQPGAAGVELSVPGKSSSGGSGTWSTLSIPGLGALPKLDFGLELLYGSPEPKSNGEGPNETLPDAFTVHGSVKKTF